MSTWSKAAARNGAYGDSVARLLAFAGHAVEREYYYNDAGNQIGVWKQSQYLLERALGDDEAIFQLRASHPPGPGGAAEQAAAADD